MLALGFIIDAFVAMDLLAWRFTRNPLGRFTRRSFTVSNLLGGLGFSLPFFYYLNKRS